MAPSACVMGNVKLEKGSSVWFNSTIRGDNDLITVGENSNIQDGCVLHSGEDRLPVGNRGGSVPFRDSSQLPS